MLYVLHSRHNICFRYWYELSTFFTLLFFHCYIHTHHCSWTYHQYDGMIIIIMFNSFATIHFNSFCHSLLLSISNIIVSIRWELFNMDQQLQQQLQEHLGVLHLQESIMMMTMRPVQGPRDYLYRPDILFLADSLSYFRKRLPWIRRGNCVFYLDMIILCLCDWSFW